ncbi:hypothetical protein IGM04_002759 [Enterococcus sp. DIV2385]|nr:DDE-type integrase/transposase/recombinase [Enterococcus faecalis]OTP10734.1 hypothetical protein A5830_002799 [Enterococcus faecalis]
MIAWNVYNKMTASIVCDILEKAVSKRKTTSSVILHSNRGSQYLSTQLRQIQEKLTIVPPYSKIAYPWDNAVAVSFFKWMKHEELKRYTLYSLEDVKLACFKYIYGCYNPRRPHSVIDMLSLNLKEEIYWQPH